MRGPDSISHEVTALRNGEDTALPGVEFEAEIGHLFPDLQKQTPEFCCRAAHDDEVVHVAKVESATLFFFDPVVETIQVDISEELAGLVPKRQSLACRPQKSSISMRSKDISDESEYVPIQYDPPNFLHQDLVVDAGEVFRDVAL